MVTTPKSSHGKFSRFVRLLYQQRLLILMLLPALTLTILFQYLPIYGIQIAFKNYKVGRTIWNAPWVGLKWFRTFFQNPYWWRLLRNTFMLGFWSLVFSFPAPILLALLLNELQSYRFKRVVQTVSYLPHFISTVILVGILKELTASNGVINNFLASIGLGRTLFFTDARWFRTLYISSEIWQGVGWGTIIYLAALAGVDPQLYEAAIIDGANRFRCIWSITIPSIFPTIIILLIMRIGGILGNDFQKILLMYSEQTYETSDVISTYTYREGIINARYSYGSAVGLMMSIFSFMLVYVTNYFSRKLTDTSLW